MAFKPSKNTGSNAYSDQSRGETPLSGYDVLSFNADEWEKIAKSFTRKDELLKCLIWLRNSDFENGKLYIESKSIADYVLNQGDWLEAIRHALPSFSASVNPRKAVKRLEKTNYRYTDKDGAEFAQKGLSIQINYLPVAKYFDNREAA